MSGIAVMTVAPLASEISLFEARPDVADREWVERLDFVGQARDLGGWGPVDLTLPVVVGLPETSRSAVPTSVRQVAMARGVVRTVTSFEDGQMLIGYRGRGDIVVDGVHWYVLGIEAAIDDTGDEPEVIPGRVGGFRIQPIGEGRVESLIALALDRSDIQLAMQTASLGGQPLGRFDQLESSSALDEVLARMSRLRWRGLRVRHLDIDPEHPFLIDVDVVVTGPAAADDLAAVEQTEQGLRLRRVPRAGARQLLGFSVGLPDPAAES